MTKAPDNVPQFVGTDEQLIDAMKHMLTRDNLTLTDKSVVKEAVDTIEAMRDQIWEMSENE